MSSLAPRLRPALTFTLLATLTTLLTPTHAAAADRDRDRCYADGPRPYVCSVVLEVSRPGERTRNYGLDEPMRLPAGGKLEIEMVAVDQFGRDFPAERVRWVFEPERSCSGLLEVEHLDREHFRVEAQSRRGSCDVRLWVPGNLNLEWLIRFEVGAVARGGGYELSYAEAVAMRLYRAILGREADAPGLAGAIAEIQRDRLSAQIDSMLRSEEFLTQRANLGAHELLRGFYRGLLDRELDPDGARTYQREVERRHYREVILAIIGSEEFEAQLVREIQSRK
ncbi:MAG TPA: DUF4214 domain-containing protein [Thermoanaerobaculia bacterium]|nr:DUF4214 domain-containing protein [Thermoanaerobaculia bacterium]